MIAVARGDRTFAGLSITPRRVLLVDMENTEADLADRFKALGITPANAAYLSELIPIHLPPLAPLDTAMGGMELGVILDAYDMQAGDVVVLDSLQRVINGVENDSDTMRAYYRHTGLMLKRRRVTVVRTDNTGKDTDKGARGTSGKRDDVDVELILTADAEKPGQMYLKPGKVRLPGIARLTMQRDTDDDGLLTYSTSGDPFRVQVTDALTLLDALDVPTSMGLNLAFDTIKNAGHKVTREALRAAVKERRIAPDLLCRTLRHSNSADEPQSAVPKASAQRPHSSPETPDLSVKRRAKDDGTATAQSEAPVSAGGVPLSSLSKPGSTDR